MSAGPAAADPAAPDPLGSAAGGPLTPTPDGSRPGPPAPQAAADAATSTVLAAEAAAPEPPPLQLPMLVDVRSASLALLAVLAVFFVLHWAEAVFIPLLVGMMLSYALSPAVDRLARWRVPRALGAAVLLLGVLAGVGAIGWSLADDAVEVVESLPEAARKLRQAMRATRDAPESPIQKVQKAATDLEKAAEETVVAAAPPRPRGVTRVQIEKPPFDVKEYLWSGTVGLVTFGGQLTVVWFIAFFLLAAGDAFRRKLVRIAGPTLTHKRITVQVLDEINQQIQRYLIVQVAVSVLVGVVTWGALAWIGLERAAVWGVLAALLNFVPYIGSLIVTVGTALVGFLQFGTVGMAVLIAAVSLVVHTISGNLLTPWLTARAGRISPVVMFVGVLGFGWLWGMAGLLLGAPLLMAVKAVCDRVEDLKPIGELLGT